MHSWCVSLQRIKKTIYFLNRNKLFKSDLMEKLTISNFRKIEQTWEFDLAPVTFFVGTNNSGKSSVLKALMLLNDFGNSNNHFLLKFNGNDSKNHKIDCYSNAVNRNNLKNKLYDVDFNYDSKDYKISIVFNQFDEIDEKFQTGRLKNLKIINNIDNSTLEIIHLASDEYQLTVDLSFVIGKNTNDDLIAQNNELEKLKNYKADTEKELLKNETIIKKIGQNDIDRIYHLNVINSLKDKLKDINLKIKEIEKKSIKKEQIFNPVFKLNDIEGFTTLDRIFRIVLSKYFRENEKKVGLSSNKEIMRISILAEKLVDLLKIETTHLSPNRNSQTRLYVNDGGINDVYNILKIYTENPIKENSDAKKFLLKWMEYFDIGKDYRIKTIGGLASIIEIEEGNYWINLVDKGFGAGQIFTILLRIANVINNKNNFYNKTGSSRFLKSKPIILIEEPEANLHPKFQTKLAELFHIVSVEYEIQFIIETHSEYIIRKTQLIFVENQHTKSGDLNSNPFKVFYFGKEGPYEMKILENGKFDRNFEEGFYDEAAKHTMQLIQTNKLKR